MQEMKIYCPRCKRKVGIWDGKSTLNVKTRCEKCKKTILFRVETKETEFVANNARKTSSGVTFC
jgi:transposase-like protein